MTENDQNVKNKRSEISKILSKNIDSNFVSTRIGFSNSKILYVEGWRAIEIANNIFGYDGWISEIFELQEEYREIVNNQYSKSYSVAYTCKCRITLKEENVSREDIGFGSVDGMTKLGKAIETGKKKAVTDALKRALRQFGNALGNCCYNKSYIRDIMINKTNTINKISGGGEEEERRNKRVAVKDSASFDNDLLELDDSNDLGEGI